MSKWEIKKWSDVLEIKNGRNQKCVENPNGKYPIYGSGGVMGYANDYICPANTVVIGRKGSINKPIFINKPFWNVDTAFGLVAKQELLFHKYLFYFCNRFDFERLNRAVTIPSLTKADLSNVQIPLPPLDVQHCIAKTLDAAADLLRLRKQQLTDLDALVKSRFIEMFGDPVTNDKRWPTQKINTLYNIIDGDRGANYPKQEDFQEEGYCLFLNAGNVTKKGFCFDKLQFVSEEKDLKLRNGKLQRQDIVLTTRGTVGNLAYYDENVSFENIRINSGMVILRNKAGLLPQFFLVYFNNPLIYKRLMSGTAQPQLPISSMKNADIIVPPISLQTKFADFVQQVEVSKALVQKSIDETQALFDSLMSKYFE